MARWSLRIARTFPELPIQIGGGIRNLQTMEYYIKAGVSYVIIGTKAVQEPHFVAMRPAREFPGTGDRRAGCEGRAGRHRWLGRGVRGDAPPIWRAVSNPTASRPSFTPTSAATA
jgi:tRNA-dihydrouridine synthase